MTAQASASLSDQLTKRLARFDLRQVPTETVDRAKLIMLDTIGCMLAASAPRYRLRGSLSSWARGDVAQASIVGDARRAATSDAAFVNAALAAHGLADSLHAPTTMHAAAVVLPAAMAMAEAGEASGARMLGAMILGTDIACRVSAALDPKAIYARGFHPTAVCGAFGAAVAASHILRSTAAQHGAALGLALQQAGGTLAWITEPSENARPLSPAIAARNGLAAAGLARHGVKGPPAPLDGDYSVFSLFNDRGDRKALLAHWGERHYLMEFSIKRHASCSYTHAGLDAMLELVRGERIGIDQIRGIVLKVPSAVIPSVTEPRLRSCYAPYVLAVGLAQGGIIIDDILEDRARAPAIGRLVKLISVTASPELDAADPYAQSAIVEIVTAEGKRVARRMDHAMGTPENPISDTHLREKFQIQAVGIVGPKRAQAIAELLDRIERQKSVLPLMKLLRTAAARVKPSAKHRRQRAGSAQ